MPLTAAKIRNAKANTKPVKLVDGHGLYLEVKPTGAKLWRYRYRIAGKENLYAVGEYPAMSLAAARAERDRARELVKQGIHPAHHRQAERLASRAAAANTFEAVAREWIGKKKSGWTPYTLRQVERFMAADVFPYIGSLPIRQITAAHLLAILQRVEGRGAETVALNLRQWMSAVFRFAVATLRADSDPAAALRGAVHRPKTEHHKPLSREQIAAFVKALDSYGGHRQTVIALRLLLLTFVRTIELRAARWEEFDFERALWTVPAERMKKREPHLVPLSRQTLVLLRELQSVTGGREYLFPNVRRPASYMTGTTLNRALEYMGLNGPNTIDVSGHGFRATASTILHELGYRSDLIELQLAHKERNKVKASYNQAQYLTERAALMQQWADLIDEIAAGDSKVMPIKRSVA